MQTHTFADGARIVVGHALLDDVELRLPPGWTAVPGDDWPRLWRHGEVRLELRVRREPAFALEVGIINEDPANPAELDSPVLKLRPRGSQLPWLGGATARVLLPDPARPGVFRQLRGLAGVAPGGDALAGIALFRERVWLPPGRSLLAAWRLEAAADGDLPADPGWLPARRYVPLGEGVRLDAPDAAVLSDVVADHMVDDVEVLIGPAGLHEVGLVDARGVTSFEVGWHAPLGELVEAARIATGRPDLRAWLTVAAGDAVDEAQLDELDACLGEALENPTHWGVLAGLQAALTTELPVGDETERAARRLLAADPGAELAPILAGLGFPAASPGRRGTRSRAWWDVLTSDDEELAHKVLDGIEHGRLSSLPAAGGARAVALASLWAATHERARASGRVVAALEVAFARQLAANSPRPDPAEVAWLLLADQWRRT